MNNPTSEIKAYLASVKIPFVIEGDVLKIQDASIAFKPSIVSANCSSVKMLMTKKADKAGFYNSTVLFVLVDKIMGKDFDIEGFFKRLESPATGNIYEIHNGVSVSIAPDPSPWVIDFIPA